MEASGQDAATIPALARRTTPRRECIPARHATSRSRNIMLSFGWAVAGAAPSYRRCGGNTRSTGRRNPASPRVNGQDLG